MVARDAGDWDVQSVSVASIEGNCQRPRGRQEEAGIWLWTATAGAQEDRQSFRELSCANLLLRQPHTGDFGPVCPQ